MTPRKHYDEELKKLGEQLTEMGSLVAGSIDGAIEAVLKGDTEEAAAVVADDDLVDRKERDIEMLCIKLFREQQPLASDLRNISAALKMITDLERIADQSADICEIALYLPDDNPITRVEHLPEMATRTKEMVRLAIKAFNSHDLSLAHKVMEMDDAVDELFAKVRTDIIAGMGGDTEHNDEMLDLFMISKYFERIGDHAESVAEWAEYAITGIHKGSQIAIS